MANWSQLRSEYEALWLRFESRALDRLHLLASWVIADEQGSTGFNSGITETFDQYPDIGPLLPAMGYSPAQIADLQAVISAAEVDAMVVGTPIDLARLVDLEKPSTRVRYSISERGEPTLGLRLRKTFDNDDYVDRVTEDDDYLQLYNGMAVREVAGIDFVK